MAKHIFTTVGTSAIANHYRSDEYADHDEVVKALEQGKLEVDIVLKSLERTLEQRMIVFEKSRQPDKLKLLTAEMASIFAMQKAVRKDDEGNEIGKIGEFTSKDKIILLHSDTVAGEICAEVTKKLLEGKIECTIEIVKVQGLRTDDAATFLEKGMKNLKEIIDEKSRAPICYYLNITGGYKGTIPFLTPIAFKYMFTIVYLHEDSDYLIVIPFPSDPSALELDELIESSWTVLYE